MRWDKLGRTRRRSARSSKRSAATKRPRPNYDTGELSRSRPSAGAMKRAGTQTDIPDGGIPLQLVMGHVSNGLFVDWFRYSAGEGGSRQTLPRQIQPA